MQVFQGQGDVARERQVAGIAAHRQLGHQRVGSHLDHLAPRRQFGVGGDPGHHGVNHQNSVGRGHRRRRRVARMHRVAIGKARPDGPVLADRQRKPLRQGFQCLPGSRVGAGALGDDQGALGFRQHAGGFLDRVRRRSRRRGGRKAAAWQRHVLRPGLAQHLPRQGKVDGPLRCAFGDRQRPVDQAGDLVAEAGVIIPLRCLPHHPGLVAHLLAPVDTRIAAAGAPGLGNRRAAGDQQDRHLVARRVQEAHNAVRQTDIGMQHHRLRLARHHRVAIGHPHRDRLVRDRERLRHVPALGHAIAVGLDDGGKIRAGIGKEIVDARLLHRQDKRIGGGAGRGSGRGSRRGCGGGRGHTGRSS